MEVSVILPCRNEEKTIGKCIEDIQSVFKDKKIDGEIIVSDSSVDYSPFIAKEYPFVRLIKHDKKGYGIAILVAARVARGKYLVIGDSDGTYDFSQMPLFLNKLSKGYDFVIGSRLKGIIKKGAMPLHHRYLGNPLLSTLLNLFFRANVSDAHCGFRAIKKESFDSLNLKSTGMEFASEMIIRAAKNKLRVAEVPINYFMRVGESKLNSFSDGWRHLRFMLMFSPTYLFFIPGLVLFCSGFFFLSLLLYGTFVVKGRDIGIYVSLASSLSSILGYQIISLGLYSRIYAIHTGFEKEDRLIDFIAQKVPLERGIMIGIVMSLLGSVVFFKALVNSLNMPGAMLSSMIFSITVLIVGIQTIFSVFFISMMLVET